MCVLAAVFVWKWVPETKGKTMEEKEVTAGKERT
jgi:hypothetical protein